MRWIDSVPRGLKIGTINDNNIHRASFIHGVDCVIRGWEKVANWLECDSCDPMLAITIWLNVSFLHAAHMNSSQWIGFGVCDGATGNDDRWRRGTAGAYQIENKNLIIKTKQPGPQWPKKFNGRNKLNDSHLPNRSLNHATHILTRMKLKVRTQTHTRTHFVEQENI